MDLDVPAVRAQFPSLALGAAHFDGPGGSQVPTAVATAVAEAMTAGLANRGAVTPAEKRADAIVVAARQAMADLLGGTPSGVILGRSMTQVTYDLSRALAKQWGPGDEVIVTRLDHDGNIRPWVQAAGASGATVRWADFDQITADLPLSAIEAVLSARTRVVAVTGASNLLGTRPDLRSISDAAHRVGAIVYVDGVHLTPHAAIDVAAFGADIFACSPYKFCGPHLGAAIADPALLETLRPDKLAPSSDAVPERFELGTLPYELLAGTTATVDFLAGLASGDGDRRSRIIESMRAIEAHEQRVFVRMQADLGAIDGVTLHGSPVRRTPTALFSVDGVSPREVYEGLGAAGVNAPAGHFYAIEASRWIGLGDTGAVRAGVALYTDDDDIARLVAGVTDIAKRSRQLPTAR